MKFLRCINNRGNEASLVVGRIYRMLPSSPVEEESGMVRIVDNEGEDYLYPGQWFEVVSEQEMTAALSESVTVHLNGRTHIAVRDLANARGVSISALVREWIDERLDLPEMEMS